MIFDMGGDQGGQVWIDDVSVMGPVENAGPVDPEAGDIGTGDNNVLDAGEVINFNSTKRCKCVANINVHLFSDNIFTDEATNDNAEHSSVPLHISSPITNVFSSAFLNIFRNSYIS